MSLEATDPKVALVALYFLYCVAFELCIFTVLFSNILFSLSFLYSQQHNSSSFYFLANVNLLTKL